ncbi:MAG: recombinase family protein [Elusimicrobiota bacterium]
MEQKQKTICAIYTRVSDEEQLTSDFTSLDSQREYAENYIKSQEALGWEVYPEKYNDPGYTGGNMDRPGLQKLLADARRGKFNAIVVYKIDRLTRSLRDFGKMWELFEKYNISFVSVTQKFDTTTSMGRLMLHILLSFAQFEREINSERTRDKKLASAKKGKWLGGYPVVGFDLDRETKKIVVNRKEVKQVEFMFKTYLKEKSCLNAAKVINERGYRTKAWITKKGRHMGGKKFCKTTLKYHLRNPIYIGKIRYGDKLYDGEHPAIIEEGLFNQVQSYLDRNGKKKSSPYKNRRYDFLLTGLVRCNYCGSTMTPGASHSKSGTYLYYRCTKVNKNDKNACKYRYIPAKELENVVIERIKFLSDSPKIVDEMIKKAHRSVNGVFPELLSDLSSKTKKQAELEIDIQNWTNCVSQRLRENKDVDLFAEGQKKLIQQQNELTKEIEQIKSKIDKIKNHIITAEAIKSNLKCFHDVFDRLEYVEKRHLLNLLIKEIRVNGDKSKIEMDLYQLPDISPSIQNKPPLCSLRTSHLRR